ncbi:MAG: nucleotidyltransferase domain-containing protein [Candidatus Pacearchaeota archaeon]
MDLEKICKNIEERLCKENFETLSAMALVGSRVNGYFDKNSDYDFSAIFKDEIEERHINFNMDGTPISVKVESEKMFEDYLKFSGDNGEKSKFVYLPYLAIKNKDYFFHKEKISRKILLDEFVEILPQNKNIKTNIDNLIEFPLIRRSIFSPDYWPRIRRLVESGSNFKEKMKPKYIESLKEIGYFISNKGEVVFKNENTEKILKINLPKYIKQKYQFAKKFGVRNKDYFYGGLCMAIHLSMAYNNEKFPIIEKRRGEFYYAGPTLNQLLDKRKSFVILENFSKKLKDKIVKNSCP